MSQGAISRQTIGGAPPAHVSYHPTDNFKVTANYSHTYLWGLPDFGVPTNQVTREPVTESGVSRDTFYGAVNRDFTKSTQDIGTVDGEWKINDHVTLENKFRASHSLLNYIGTIPENPSATGATAPYSSTPDLLLGLCPVERAKPVRAGRRH